MKSASAKIIKFEKLAAKALIALDVGCGDNKQAGCFGMDRRNLPNVDDVHDIEKFPWPFPPERFHRIICSHILEHVKPWLMIEIMDEMWRVMKFGGELMIAMPYAGSFGHWQDPTHIKCWNEATATYYDPSMPLYQVYKPKPWKILINTWHSDGNIEVVLKKIKHENAD